MTIGMIYWWFVIIMIRRNTVSLIFIPSMMMLMPMETLLIIMATDIYVISIIMLQIIKNLMNLHNHDVY